MPVETAENSVTTDAARSPHGLNAGLEFLASSVKIGKAIVYALFVFAICHCQSVVNESYRNNSTHIRHSRWGDNFSRVARSNRDQQAQGITAAAPQELGSRLLCTPVVQSSSAILGDLQQLDSAAAPPAKPFVLQRLPRSLKA